MSLLMVFEPREGRETIVMLDFKAGDKVEVEFVSKRKSYATAYTAAEGKLEILGKDQDGTIFRRFEGDLLAVLVKPSRWPERVRVQVNACNILETSYEDALELVKFLRI